MEAELYNAVTEYVQEEFNRADKLNSDRKTTVGFALPSSSGVWLHLPKAF